MDNNHKKDKTLNATSLDSNSIKKIEDFNPISYFKKDKNFVFVHQKLEKLGAAIYMITNFFDTEEPLKWSLRKLSAELLRLNILLQSDIPKNAEENEQRMKEVILETVSLLDIASFASLISSMNVSIIKKEFQAVLDTIRKVSDQKDRVTFGIGKDFFSTTVVDYSDETSVRSKLSQPVEYIKDKIYINQGHETTPLQQSASRSNSESKDVEHKLKSFSPVAVKKSKRQSLIIALLRRRKEIMVKDVFEVIDDCSEKTIQRELLALVEEGVLKKEGERRWTKYSLL